VLISPNNIVWVDDEELLEEIKRIKKAYLNVQTVKVNGQFINDFICDFGSFKNKKVLPIIES
jgi:hypothetical protein